MTNLSAGAPRGPQLGGELARSVEVSVDDCSLESRSKAWYGGCVGDRLDD